MGDALLCTYIDTPADKCLASQTLRTQLGPCEPASLQLLCVASLVRNPYKIKRVDSLPEDACVLLLRALFSRYALTPRLVRLFQRCGHTAVANALEDMNLDLAAGIYVYDNSPPPRQLGDGPPSKPK